MDSGSLIIDTHSFSELFEFALRVESQGEADDIKEAILKFTNKKDHPSFWETVKGDIAYAAERTNNRHNVEKFFDCEHPVFGKLSEVGPVTQQEAFECGKQMTTLKELRKKQSL